jgi:formamidopyrimidine-DNA glycosylase
MRGFTEVLCRQFTLHLDDDDSDVVTEVAFTDVRRLGRIRLCKSPRTELPISELGFDPILSMPTLDEFSPMVRRRSCPIKVLLLDQSFSAGVGNWVADEILYNAKIHPEQRCNTLTDSQITSLHYFVANICEIAVAVDADSERFPSHWLFKHRWVSAVPPGLLLRVTTVQGKGKKKTRTTTLTLVLIQNRLSTVS